MRSVFSYFFFLVCMSGFSQSADIFDVARKGSLADVQLIVKNDPKSLNKLSPEGFSPLILACYRGNNSVAKFIIENGGNIDGNSPMGTALMAAVVKSNHEIAELLLTNKANPNIADPNGTTALMYAVKFQNAGLVKLLLANNADKSKLDKDGKSAFEYAAFSGNNEIIQLLK